MKQFLRRAGALALAFAVTASAASASVALGWNLHTASLPISQGTALDKTIFWSDTYSDLRREFCVTYTPNPDVTPTVAYGDKVLTKATLTEMAASLESQGKRVVSGLNGDWYVVSTGSTTGLLVTDGILRATPYYTTAWAIGFNADGTAFIGQPGLTTTVTLPFPERQLCYQRFPDSTARCTGTVHNHPAYRIAASFQSPSSENLSLIHI